MYKTVLAILGILFLIFIIFFMGGIYFTNDYVSEEVDKLIEHAGDTQAGTFSYSQLDTLPPVLQNYFTKVLNDGMDKPVFVRLKQNGFFKNNFNSGFKKLTAEQYYITDKPGFLWKGTIDFMPAIWMTGIDSYNNGRGDLVIKFMSGATITNESGMEINQAQLARWITETPWFPAALLPGGCVTWVESGSASATASIKVDTIEVKAKFHFSEDGLIDKVTTERYMTTIAGPKLTGFTGYFSDYKRFGGVLIPAHAEVEWNLDDQDFRYGKFNITEIEFDKLSEFE